MALEGTFAWDDGAAFTYANWASSPDNAGGVEHCITLLGDGTWQDDACSLDRVGVCAADYTLCGNGIMDVDAGETGVDCGGSACPACASVTVTYSSGTALSGATVTAPAMSFTATFGQAVSDVAVADFGLVATGGVTTSTSLAPVTTAPSTTWVLNVTLGGTLQPSTVSVAAMAANTGSVSPANDAGSNNYTLSYDPPQPVYSTSASLVHASTFEVTATFDSAVSGVAASDFGVTSSAGGLGYAVSVASADGAAAHTVWVATLSITGARASSILQAAAMPTASGAIHPANQAGSAPLAVVYQPPVPTLSSQLGASGVTVSATSITITATFASSAVSGVAVSDFGLVLDGAAASAQLSVASASGGGSDTVWVLTATPTTTAAGAVTVTGFGDGSGSITPANAAATNTPFTLNFEPPVPTLSSGLGTTGSNITASPITFTATFSHAVTGVSVADFRLHPGTLSVLAAVTPQATPPTTQWVLSVVPVGGLAASSTVTVQRLAAASGAVSPANAQGLPAGGYALTYRPPMPSYTTNSTPGATTSDPVFLVTATFSQPVTGLVAGDFGAAVTPAGVIASATASAVGGVDPGVEWLLTVTILGNRQPATVSVTPMAEATGVVSPPNGAGGDAWTFLYSPPVPTFSSASGANGTRVAGQTHSFTATFTTPVSGVTAGDFGFTAPGVGTGTSVAPASGTAPDAVWVLTVTLSAPLRDTRLTLNMPTDVTQPPNAPATNNGFFLDYVAPPCEADPCNIAAGFFATSCTNIDALNGTFTCTCRDRYGALCKDLCPPGYVVASDISPPRCTSVTAGTTWSAATDLCTAGGGSFASVQSLTQSQKLRDVCAAYAGNGTSCWIAASDAVTEGIWLWQDSSPFSYTNWDAGQPDNVRVGCCRFVGGGGGGGCVVWSTALCFFLCFVFFFSFLRSWVAWLRMLCVMRQRNSRDALVVGCFVGHRGC